MIDIENLTTWDVYKMVLNAKPLSDKKYEQNAEFSRSFDDMYFNEAVELAKKYGTDDSGRFVNGILGAMIK